MYLFWSDRLPISTDHELLEFRAAPITSTGNSSHTVRIPAAPRVSRELADREITTSRGQTQQPKVTLCEAMC
jgi:hypothetical protein